MKRSLVASLAFAFAACGGGDRQAEAPAADTPAPGAEAPAGGGATHNVNMVLEGTSYRFVPENLTIRSGDQVIWHNVSGGPHNVQFFADSIPPAGRDVLNNAMPNRIGDLNGELLVEPAINALPVLTGYENHASVTELVEGLDTAMPVWAMDKPPVYVRRNGIPRQITLPAIAPFASYGHGGLAGRQLAEDNIRVERCATTGGFQPRGRWELPCAVISVSSRSYGMIQDAQAARGI